jgi:hypothetical protein
LIKKVTVHDRIKEISFCWNVGTTHLGSPWKEQTSGDGGVPGPRLPKASQAGLFQHSNKSDFFEFVFGSYGRASEASLYANHILCLVGMLERLVPGALERKSLGHNY